MSEHVPEPKPPDGSEPAPAMRRCPVHGIAYDVEREVCPECAKVGPAAPDAPTHAPIEPAA